MRNTENERTAARPEARTAAAPGLLTLVEVAGAIVMIAAGLLVYKATGLYGEVESVPLKLGLGAAISYWLVTNSRIALHDRRDRR